MAKAPEEQEINTVDAEETVATETDVTEVTAETGDAEVDGSTEETKLAKAGKRSAKALAEAEEKAAKEARKAAREDQEEFVEKKGPAPKTRTLLERRSKSYKKAHSQIDADKTYDLKSALELATKTSPVKFDATVELHVRLNVNPKLAEENIRGNVVLPHGTGKVIRVAVFGNADDIKAAKAAGADIAGEADFLDQLAKEQIDFDVLISTPQMMSQLGKFARLLGPKGLMPNPKSGTVTANVADAVSKAKAGLVEYRVDPTGIIHLGIGKVSFGGDKLNDNAQIVLESIQNAKPGSIKGQYIESMFVSTSMGPSIKVQ